MGDSVEDLLAQIKAQYADANQSDAAPTSAEQPPQALSPQSSSSQQLPSLQPSERSPHSIDHLLAEVEGKPSPSRQADRSPLLPIAPQPGWQQVESLSSPPTNCPSQQESSSPTSQSQAATDRLLHELKTQYDECDRAEELQQQEQRRIEEQRRQEQRRIAEQKQQAELQQQQRRQAELKRQKQIAATRQAEEWLKRLDPRSGEAAWFDEFAAKYESRLEAAIDYLGLEEQ